MPGTIAPSRIAQPRRGRSRAVIVGQYLLLTLLAVAFLYPVFWAVTSAFKPAATIINDPLGIDISALTLDNFRRMFADVPIGRGFVNTGIMLAIKGGMTMFFCPLAGYAFAKYQFRFKNLIFSAVLLTLMLPTLVLIIPLLLQMSQLGWVNTYQALILPGSIDAFAIFWMRQTIAAVPDELLDAARVDGASEFGVYWRIIVPTIRPGLAALGVLTTMNIYNDFVWPVVVASDESTQTLQVVLSTLAQNITGNRVGADFATVWGGLLAASTLALIPLVVIFVLLQRHFINGILAGSLKG